MTTPAIRPSRSPDYGFFGTLTTCPRLEAIGIDPVVACASAKARNGKLQVEAQHAPTNATDAPKPVAIRAGTKQAQIIALLQRPEGLPLPRSLRRRAGKPTVPLA